VRNRGRRIAITGVSSLWGSALARALGDASGVEAVVGIDTRPPPGGLDWIEFLEADIRSPELSRLLPGTEVDTIVHCGILWYPEPGKPAGALHDINVIGTLQLLAACERTTSLERVVVRGSAAIYGCEGAAPAFFTEELARRMPLRTRFQRDISELEEYFENFARRRRAITCCMLRYQPEIAPGLEAPFARYLALPVVPTQLGFDPRLQLLDARDATAALLAAIDSEVEGPVNVAPTGAIALSHALGILGRPSLPIPHPLFGAATAQLGRRLGTGPLYGDAVRFLRYGRGVDNRRLTEEVGFEPALDAVGVIERFAAGLAAGEGPTGSPGALAGEAA
jgi:UDP-glucose 4-epimerase